MDAFDVRQLRIQVVKAPDLIRSRWTESVICWKVPVLLDEMALAPVPPDWVLYTHGGYLQPFAGTTVWLAGHCQCP
jgi:hypothetical protein